MTLEEACRIIDPTTGLSELDKIEYYHGFNGKDAAANALREASQMVVDFVRRQSERGIRKGECSMKKILIEHEVSPGYAKCTYGGDYDGYEVCKYHTFRNRTHGPRRPTEYHKPKCILFDCWLDEPYKKCESCRKACMEEDKNEIYENHA